MKVVSRPLTAVPASWVAVRGFSSAVSLAKADTYIPLKSGTDRQSVLGLTTTIFGANGFVGRYVVNRLARVGSECIIPYRGDGMNVRHLKLMGDLGKVIPLPVDFRDEESLRSSVARSNVVVNLLGNIHETVNYSYDDTHVKCVHRACKVAAEAGTVKRFIHVSALGADINSSSAFLRSKALGEEVVRDFFPQATILRPAPIFGDEDQFLNRMADLVNFSPMVPVIGLGEQKIQPIFVEDVAQAIVSAVVDADAPGRIYELGGPETFTKKQIIEWIAREIGREDETIIVPLSKRMCRLYARVLTLLPTSWRLLTPDQVDQMEMEMVLEIKKGIYGLSDLGIKPVSISHEGKHVLMRHKGDRDGPQFNLPKGDKRAQWLRE